jgi:excinuclease ABC subunit A
MPESGMIRVAMGRPEDIAAEPRSYTGQFLRDLLGRRPGRKAEAAE